MEKVKVGVEQKRVGEGTARGLDCRLEACLQQRGMRRGRDGSRRGEARGGWRSTSEKTNLRMGLKECKVDRQAARLTYAEWRV